jgi:hypothetical protein
MVADRLYETNTRGITKAPILNTALETILCLLTGETMSQVTWEDHDVNLCINNIEEKIINWSDINLC